MVDDSKDENDNKDKSKVKMADEVKIQIRRENGQRRKKIKI